MIYFFFFSFFLFGCERVLCREFRLCRETNCMHAFEITTHPELLDTDHGGILILGG